MQPAVIALCLFIVYAYNTYTQYFFTIQRKEHVSTGKEMCAVHTQAETEAQCKCTTKPKLLLSNECVSDKLVNPRLNIENV